MDYEGVKAKAEEFLRTHNPQVLAPFPFADAAERLGDVDIVYVRDVDDTVSGAIYYKDGRLKIVINVNKPLVRQNFTLAHEFGHYVLHRDWLDAHKEDGLVDFAEYVDGGAPLFRRDTPVLTDEAAILREREANNFAAELLMPEDKLRELWDINPDIERAAEIFRVSKIAMAIRLERLGMIS
ncbi:MAG TPA: ImmA/IrrE family metallo-endopeptidase [Candidatus Saccharimonadales bacterium]|jgi:Zn-dependent peptidase ImmA (M78 family)|nr:ImmA/IrrE family metallo-endopeptidase [Candidatus Saccharimonadales bacterium]